MGGDARSAARRNAEQQQSLIDAQMAEIARQRAEAEKAKADSDAEIKRREELRRRRGVGRLSLLGGSELGVSESLGVSNV